MKTLPSTEFRKTFHKLTEPALVNVLGHVIGVWSPIAHVRAGLGHPGDENHALAKVVEQEEEIRRLKRELAKRPPANAGMVKGLKHPVATHVAGEDGLEKVAVLTNPRTWTPDRQKVVDEALRKVNRTTKEKKP